LNGCLLPLRTAIPAIPTTVTEPVFAIFSGPACAALTSTAPVSTLGGAVVAVCRTGPSAAVISDAVSAVFIAASAASPGTRTAGWSRGGIPRFAVFRRVVGTVADISAAGAAPAAASALAPAAAAGIRAAVAASASASAAVAAGPAASATAITARARREGNTVFIGEFEIVSR
jgi:hypothetical protein